VWRKNVRVWLDERERERERERGGDAVGASKVKSITQL
jgi:hypothetical protein